MSVIELKAKRRVRRKKRVRRRIYGTAERPRLSIYRSLGNMYAQLIDDDAGHTLVEASTQNKEMKQAVGYGGNAKAATEVGKLLAERATAKGIRNACFDRNGFRYQGRIEALAEAARSGGLDIGPGRPQEAAKSGKAKAKAKGGEEGKDKGSKKSKGDGGKASSKGKAGKKG